MENCSDGILKKMQQWIYPDESGQKVAIVLFSSCPAPIVDQISDIGSDKPFTKIELYPGSLCQSG